MRVEHSVYLIIKSEDIEPPEVTRLVGLAPDLAKAKHSRTIAGSVKVPRAHLWQIDSGLDAYEPIERHVEALTLRVAPYAQRIGAIVGARTKCFLTIVRRYHTSPAPAPLGFGLDGGTVELLATMRAEVDIDEYDYTEVPAEG
ncbi:MAG: DUF4279 domain-containing protein [Acidimicrobiales bacterium]